MTAYRERMIAGDYETPKDDTQAPNRKRTTTKRTTKRPTTRTSKRTT